MQLFIRDPSGQTTSFTASTPLELQSQLFDTLNVAPSEIRLSHRSRTLQLSQSSSSLEELNLSPYSTIDLSFRLRGGGPKKRCAHVFVKATSGSGSSTPSGSGVATPASTAAAPSVASSAAAAVAPVAAIKEKKQGEVKEGENKAEGAEIQASGPVSAIPAVAEPVLERCSNAALRMVGECPKCSKNFCGQHRLPEDHACPALQTFRKAAFDENMKRLNKEATFTSKISAF